MLVLGKTSTVILKFTRVYYPLFNQIGGGCYIASCGNHITKPEHLTKLLPRPKNTKPISSSLQIRTKQGLKSGFKFEVEPQLFQDLISNTRI